VPHLDLYAGFMGGKWFGFSKFGFVFGLRSLGGGEALNLAINSFDWRTSINTIGIFGMALVVIAFIFLRDRESVITSNSDENFFKSVTTKIIGVAKNHRYGFPLYLAHYYL
jgi:hypothetical protein